MTIWLIHGIHSKEGDHNMSRLFPHMKQLFPDHEVKVFEYGFMGFWKARWANNGVAEQFASLINEGDVVITHSNGAAITYLAVVKHGAKPAIIVNINPALDRWRTAPAKRIMTIHSDGDRAVWWSQWLPGHIWGDQGKVGYKGKERHVTNIPASEFDPPMAYNDHMSLFSNSRIKHWALYIEDWIRMWLK